MASITPVAPAPIERSFAAASIAASCETIATNSNDMLLNTFFIQKKPYQVFFSAGKISWKKDKTKQDKTTVPVEDVIAIQSQANELVTSDVVNSQSDSDEKHPDIKEFTIVYAKRVENSSNPNKWRHFSKTFRHNDTQVCQLWVRTLQQHIDEQTTRPKRLLLFVNPYGGKKRALQIYDGTVKPIFQLAGIDASVVISQRSNQIRDFIMTQSLEHFDGIVCIGGDGTFSEVFNGVLFRTFKDLGFDDVRNLDEMPKIEKPIGIIPAGSTDTVAYCLNGTCDIRTTVLNIALGQVNGLDLSSVSNQNNLLKFYASVMSYGFLGDVAVESEKFRWMGPKRYDYSGFKKLILNRGYNGEISMLMAPLWNNPTSGRACLQNCKVCTMETHQSPNQRIEQNTVIKSKDERTSDKCENNNEQTANQLTNNIYNDVHMKYLKVEGESEQNCDAYTEHSMKTVNAKFFMVNGANISCACPRSPNGFSKYCHLCDGYIDLILVRHTTFFNNIRFLLAMSSRNCKITDLPHVEIYRTKQFSFRPTGIQTGASAFNLHSSRIPISMPNDSNHTSVWNCDGEVINNSEVFIRSHKHLINVYRRGLHNPQSDENDGNSETNCCC